MWGGVLIQQFNSLTATELGLGLVGYTFKRTGLLPTDRPTLY